MAVEIAVSGYGLHTSLGGDAMQSAALVRAGLNRFHKGQRDRYTSASIKGPWYDQGWLHKLEFFLAPALFEAMFQADALELLARRKVHVFLAIPSLRREGTEDELTEALPARLRDMFMQLGCEPQLHFLAADHTSALAAISKARRLLSDGDAELALVIALDSQLHSPHLSALEEQGRVKTERAPSGIIPGDACAVLVLETVRHAKARRASIHALLGVVAEAEHGTPFQPEAPISADALSDVLRAVIEIDDISACRDVFVDLTGERWRFTEWALAETRCLARLPYGYQTHHPADCLGDTGAACGATMIVLAIRAFARDYANGKSALVVTSNDTGQRAAMLVHAEER